MKPHIHQEGSRDHVLSWTTKGAQCSEPDCEVNHRQATTAIPGTWTHPMPVDVRDKAYYEDLLRKERAARVAAEKQLRELQAEYDGVFYLGIRKWFDEEPENRLQAAGDAREIALKAIEAQAARAEAAEAKYRKLLVEFDCRFARELDDPDNCKCDRCQERREMFRDGGKEKLNGR